MKKLITLLTILAFPVLAETVSVGQALTFLNAGIQARVDWEASHDVSATAHDNRFALQVPYTGATADVDIGVYTLSAGALNVAGVSVLSDVINATDTVVSIDPNSRYLRDSGGHISVDWTGHTLGFYDSTPGSGTRQTTVDWVAKTLSTFSGIYSANQVSVDWASRYMYDYGGSSISVDWGNRYLSDSSGVSSVDWGSRYLLINNGGTAFSTVDWSNCQLYPVSSQYPSIDWNNKALKDASNNTILDWSNGYIYFDASYLYNVPAPDLSAYVVGNLDYVVAGSTASAAQYGVSIGYQAYGTGASVAIGSGANASDNGSVQFSSVSIGQSAGSGAYSTYGNVLIGEGAGYGAYSSPYTVCIGFTAGYGMDNSQGTIALGNGSGYNSSYVQGSVFLGELAGYEADYASYSTFLGLGSGLYATSASHSLFLGSYAGSIGSDSSGAMANKFVVDMSLKDSYTYRASTTDIEQNALFYGNFADTAAFQMLRINAMTTFPQGISAVGGSFPVIYTELTTLADTSANASIYWGSRQLIASDSASIALDWSTPGVVSVHDTVVQVLDENDAIKTTVTKEWVYMGGDTNTTGTWRMGVVNGNMQFQSFDGTNWKTNSIIQQ